MDEAALLPTMLYVQLTALVAVLAIETLGWLHATALTVGAVALLLVLESGIAYEGAKKALRY